MKKPADLKLILTTGDTDGIGDEVVCKALLRLRSGKGAHFTVLTAPTKHKLIRRLRAEVSKRLPHVSFVETSTPPPVWVEEGARTCLEKRADALVTGPMSKTLIRDSGFSEIGHTEILARVCGVEKQSVRMGFLGSKFSVVLATGHLPIKDVATHLSFDTLFDSIKLADQFRRVLSKKQATLPMALVALNPHAGDGGLIGNEESTVFEQVLSRAKALKVKIDGPIVPDAAFLPQNWRRFSVYICAYHDQGLIPFKAVHGQESGAHITLGLPIIRTSVDHGTAKDLFGKNRADPGSMVAAIDLALRLCRSRHN